MKKYFHKPVGTKLTVFMVTLCALAVVLCFISFRLSPLVWVFITGFMMWWREKMPLAILHEDHFEMTLAPAAPTRRVFYTEIAEIEERDRVLWLNASVNGKSERIKLPLKFLTERDGRDLIEEMKARVTKVRS